MPKHTVHLYTKGAPIDQPAILFVLFLNFWKKYVFLKCAAGSVPHIL